MAAGRAEPGRSGRRQGGGPVNS